MSCCVRDGDLKEFSILLTYHTMLLRSIQIPRFVTVRNPLETSHDTQHPFGLKAVNLTTFGLLFFQPIRGRFDQEDFRVMVMLEVEKAEKKPDLQH